MGGRGRQRSPEVAVMIHVNPGGGLDRVGVVRIGRGKHVVGIIVSVGTDSLDMVCERASIKSTLNTCIGIASAF